MRKSLSVLIVMGSDSDFPMISPALKILKKFDIPFEVKVCSAHRTPEDATKLAKNARKSGVGVIIAAAGLAAHLPGVLAAHTTLPVIGVPISGGALNGVDALYAIVQMPKGIPVAAVAIDGAVNAALLAIQILSLNNRLLGTKMTDYKTEMAEEVRGKDRALQEKLKEI
jgi:5-(carboxyamino)imidazole ribonucleotide mutase